MPACSTARRRLLLLAPAGLLGACATPEPEGPPRKEIVWAVLGDELIRFNAGQPRRILGRLPFVGGEVNERSNERFIGIDFRVARGQLYALAASGRLYRIDTSSGRLTRIGNGAVALTGGRFGTDFNPTVDRMRVTSDSGLNIRLHPDTGAAVATDPPPAYVSGDRAAGRQPRITGLAYNYNKRDEKLTSNYAIDIAQGSLVLLGTKEGVQPAVSPNTGQLSTVGSLGVADLEDASFDIADTDNTALAALRTNSGTRLYRIDLDSGRASPIGTIGDGRPVSGIAIEP